MDSEKARCVQMSIHVENIKDGKRRYKKYWCPVPGCGAWKRTYEDLREHIRYYHDSGLIEDVFKCLRCKKDYKTVRRLARHKCPNASPRIQEFKEKKFTQALL
jgi:DNA-directed RNA polymerase subunit RPC12/RpoP